MDLQSSVLDELERRRRKAALLQSKMWAATSAELATSAAGSSAAVDMDDLWGGGDSSDDDGFGDDGCDDSLGMAEHDAAVMKSRMANVGFQSTVGFQYEELLQFGFENGMTAGLSEGRDAGYWVGVAAALQALPPELRAAAKLTPAAMPAVAAAAERMRRAAHAQFDQENMQLQQRAARFEASNDPDAAGGGGRRGSGVQQACQREPPSPLASLASPEERQLLAAWAPRTAAPPITSGSGSAAAQPLMLGLPHRVFVHGDFAVAMSRPRGLQRVASAAGKPPRLVSQGRTAQLYGSADSLLALARPIGTLDGEYVSGVVYAVDDGCLASLDALHSGGARQAVPITLLGDEQKETEAVLAQCWVVTSDAAAAVPGLSAGSDDEAVRAWLEREIRAVVMEQPADPWEALTTRCRAKAVSESE